MTAKRRAKRHPINDAIREIMDAHGLTYRDTAELIYVSVPTVFSWFRSTPSRAKKMALAALCYRLDIRHHPLLDDKRRGAAPKR